MRRDQGLSDMSTRTRDLTIVLGVTAVAIALRAGELSPTSLFVDDQWVAYIDRVGFQDSARVGLTSVGFVAGLKAWFSLVGFSETTAQLPAFIAGCVAPALLYVVIRRWIGWPFGLLAAGLLTVNQLHISYSYHVKQYTFDALWSVACLAIAVEFTRRGLSARLALVAIGSSVVAAAISFTTIVASSGVFVLVVWLIVSETAILRSSDASIGNEPPGEQKRTIIVGVAVLASGLAIASWYLLVVRPNVTDGIRDFWSDHYVDRRGLLTSFRSLATRYVELVANTFNLDDRSALAVILCAICGLLIAVALLKRPVPMIAVGVPLALAGGLAYFGLAPLGGGRTDLHLIVLVIAGTTGGIEVVLRSIPSMSATRAERDDTDPVVTRPTTMTLLALTGFLAFNAVFLDRPEPRAYPDNDVSALVEVIDQRREPSEAIVLHRSVHAYGLYSERPSQPVSDGYLFAPQFTGDELMARLQWAIDSPGHAETLERISGATNAIWLLSSPIGGPEQLDAISDILGRQLDFQLENRIVGQGAILDHWVRPEHKDSDMTVDG